MLNTMKVIFIKLGKRRETVYIKFVELNWIRIFLHAHYVPWLQAKFSLWMNAALQHMAVCIAQSEKLQDT